MVSPAFAYMASKTPTPTGTRLQVAWCTDGPQAKNARPTNRAAHLDWITTTGIFELGGPFLNHAGSIEGSLLVANAIDISNLLKEDPYAKAGVFEKTEIRSWTKGAVKNKSGSDLGDDTNWFIVWCIDRKGMLETRKKTRASHLEWWKESARHGWIGPFVGEDGQSEGSMIVCEGESIDEIAKWAETDPYKKEDLFEEVRIREFKKVVEHFEIIKS